MERPKPFDKAGWRRITRGFACWRGLRCFICQTGEEYLVFKGVCPTVEIARAAAVAAFNVYAENFSPDAVLYVRIPLEIEEEIIGVTPTGRIMFYFRCILSEKPVLFTTLKAAIRARREEVKISGSRGGLVAPL
jgi:hypothetical protein